MQKMIKWWLATLVTGAFLGGVLLSNAETPDIFTRHGLPIPGAYFKNKESQQPASIAVSKSGQGVGDQTGFSVTKTHTQHLRAK
ncbi:MAG TPA: hypothetical protein VFO40_02425 [Chthoniobacterales bacterium]|nr:hypothetical protein [Chthoniobacterales bacterium]